MRFEPDDNFWVVTDPIPASQLADICVETSLRSLELQFRGGLLMESNPTIFTDAREAEYEAYGRLMAMRAMQAVRCSAGSGEPGIERIELYDAEGRLVFETELEGFRS